MNLCLQSESVFYPFRKLKTTDQSFLVRERRLPWMSTEAITKHVELWSWSPDKREEQYIAKYVYGGQS
ncbi:hypothetical protein ACN42_g1954 [Penicillium freii]|uniref:Uncharacterized protein n=1 Tax=Penicillium freii TaxID=48697 RepID=A0A117NRB2_PENFR|nr:hypothetical protein ACN42_g1954 [Penicillium freii]